MARFEGLGDLPRVLLWYANLPYSDTLTWFNQVPQNTPLTRVQLYWYVKNGNANGDGPHHHFCSTISNNLPIETSFFVHNYFKIVTTIIVVFF